LPGESGDPGVERKLAHQPAQHSGKSQIAACPGSQAQQVERDTGRGIQAYVAHHVVPAL